MQIKQDQRAQQHDPVAGTMKRYKERENRKTHNCKLHLRVSPSAFLCHAHPES